MPTLLFRCPTTGRNVQAWLADDAPAGSGETYELVTCLVRVHLVNRATGKVLGHDIE